MKLKKHIRNLEVNDSIQMIDWMNDSSITAFLDKDFSNYSHEDCLQFINKSRDQYRKQSPEELNYAVVDSRHKYAGTVSLKNISNGAAEFAIVINSSNHGTGLAWNAMRELLSIGFYKYKLKIIYWYFSKKNIPAKGFYLKNGFCILDDDFVKSCLANQVNNLKYSSKYNYIMVTREQFCSKFNPS